MELQEEQEKMKSRGYLPLKNPEDNQVDRERP